ncbi:Protein of unknown function DUF928 [Trichormus variabilis ATCC 29413]|uniref:DUF928 domain-containing protein n=2 Tax=Anabaena variabilis TaxID=264691 RepID=Q3M9B6_TRIV2|nr:MULTISPECIES: DUF928 domain-containing protein [Nostocaceae]ABA22420.1 Protein of unknown function DUF928 [Trichormus variabilis ATCC 29413]MBC1214945.1 DUF928 domain-containing protein [Trichormus variabilis ARAD]MBC1258657.1 DUF928 domain-containing protein [Trichormus variabilis V5]MBC1268557.1 DUF928 domain-containing protein [Trichormus variabilis FSR]MBC1303305.1 DUF928 domain-containing protein [Trichormus variabilis N2B]
MSKNLSLTINPRLVTSASLGLLLFLTPVAVTASSSSNRRQPASDYSRSAGKRGCPNDSSETIPLTVLAPQTYVGYTTELRPTFVGFVSSPQKVELRIFEFTSDKEVKQLGNAVHKDVKSGIFQIPLPEENPDLTIGKKYLWQLSMRCSGVNIVEAAEFIVVEISSTLKSKLPSTANGLQKATVLAEENLWYDALNEALKLANNGKLGDLGAKIVKSFAKNESPKPTEIQTLVQKRIQFLHKIADQEKD